MLIRQEIEKAIITLEAKRSLLIPEVADVAIATLRQKLATLAEPLPAPQQARGAVLVADMSGFTTVSELMDAEEVRDLINAVWQKLDSVIDSWGGQVDKHVGDAVIAFFGLPVPREDDRERAVQAALDMQIELGLFNDGPLRQMNSSLPQNRALRMRIGVHYGTVLLGNLGGSGDYTVMGDTVTVTHQLEQLAPVDKVLVSHQIYEHIHPYFDVDVREGLTFNGKEGSGRAYVIVREKPRAFQRSDRGTSFLETRLVGRTQEIGRLQSVLQTTIEAKMAQVVTVVAEAGLGKSRLLYEFERLLSLWPDQVILFRGGADSSVMQQPYSLIRDLFVNHFDIHRRNSASVAREKLARGFVAQYGEDNTKALTRAHFIGQLLGFDFSDSPLLGRSLIDSRQLREYAFDDLVAYFSAVCQHNDAAVIFFEDFHWADEWSFDLLEYLVAECQQLPLMFVCLARPDLLEKRPTWHVTENHNQQTYHHIRLQPLSLIDSRHLLSELLQQADKVPLRLSEMILNGAQGNPRHLVELTKMLAKEGVIDTSGSRWFVRMGNLAELPATLSLPKLIANRLERLSPGARKIVQLAAVMGTFFWDVVLVQLSAEDKNALNLEEITAVLDELVDLGWIKRHKNSVFSGTQEYAFGNDELQQIAYDGLSEEERQRAHARIASWLITHESPQTSLYSGMVAYHFEMAEKFNHAAVWYGRAAERAREDQAPETAVRHYYQALNILPTSLETAAQRVLLNEGLGEMLRWLAWFDETVEAYQSMVVAAQTSGDSRGEVRGLLGLYMAHFFQDDLLKALDWAQKADRVATSAGLANYQLMTQAAVGWVLVQIGDQYTAIQIGKALYNNMKDEAAPLPKAYMQALLGHVARESGHYERAANTTEAARERFREQGELVLENMMLAQLGRIAYEQRDWEEAENYYQTCWRHARDLGDVYGMVLALRHLGILALERCRYEPSAAYLLQAFTQAEKSGNDVLRMQVSSCLGQLYLRQAVAEPQSARDLPRKEEHSQEAYQWLEQTLKLARTLDRPLVTSAAVAGLAQLFLEDHLLDEAMAKAVTGVETALAVRKQQFGQEVRHVTAVAWRVLAMVLAKEPTRERKATIQQRLVNAEDCFSRSHRLLSDLGTLSRDELLRTIKHWARYERLRDNTERAAALLSEAERLSQATNEAKMSEATA